MRKANALCRLVEVAAAQVERRAAVEVDLREPAVLTLGL